MKKWAIILLTLPAYGVASQAEGLDYPSCYIAARRSLYGHVHNRTDNHDETHTSWRTQILQADIGNARKSRRLTETEAEELWRQVERILTEAYTDSEGHGSANPPHLEDRETALDAIAWRFCRVAAPILSSGATEAIAASSQ